jgi:hypothetical protein
MSLSTVDRRVRAGELAPWFGDVYRVLPSNGWLDDVRAAVLALPGAVASHQAAAALHEFPGVNPAPVVTVHTRTTHAFEPARVHRAHDMAPAHVEARSGLLVTTPARTVVDLAAVVPPLGLAVTIQQLVIGRQVEIEAIRTVLDEVARKGKPGVRSLRATLQRLGNGEFPMSVLEQRGERALRRAGVPAGEREFPIPWEPERRFDVAWPDARLAVEWDSRRWHGALEQMTFDRRRDRTAQRHGWVLIRFTWDDVTLRPGEVANEVRLLLAVRTPASC